MKKLIALMFLGLMAAGTLGGCAQETTTPAPVETDTETVAPDAPVAPAE